jgi:UDP-glucose 4-epimerase
MRREGVREMVFASSSSVYGEPDEVPVGGEAPARPVSVYGASKAACESLIHAYSKLYGIKAVVLRYANVVGPRLRRGVVYDFVVKLRKNRNELEILGDGKQVRSYVYVDDAVEATVAAWRKSASAFEVYNVASEDWITVDARAGDG